MYHAPVTCRIKDTQLNSSVGKNDPHQIDITAARLEWRPYKGNPPRDTRFIDHHDSGHPIEHAAFRPDRLYHHAGERDTHQLALALVKEK